MPKVLPLVKSCGACPNYGYYSGGAHMCKLTEEIVLVKEQVAPFCPLPDFPSHVIANMERTIRDLREPHKFVFVHTLLSHVAAKLNLNLEADGRGIKILFKYRKEEREVHLHYDSILDVSIKHSLRIEFIYRGKKFRLWPDCEPPKMDEHLGEVTGLEGKDLWTSHLLAVRAS